MTDAYLQAVNAAIAKNYDAVLFDAESDPQFDVARVCGLASLYGPVKYPVDVLDLGCGTGAQLELVASQVSGRVAGIDISPESCRIAKERLAPFGDRAAIRCCDLMEIGLEELGQFDIIYNIGVIYVTPPEVQRRILDLIGKCLRPGGVAIMSYYAGSIPALRANLHQTLRASCTGLEPAAAIARARKQLGVVAGSLENVAGMDLLRKAVVDTERQTDRSFFHEVLNKSFESMRTSAIERTLSQHGVSFANYLPPFPETELGQSSIQRAIRADLTDFGHGQYNYAIYAKYDAPSLVGFAELPDMWESLLTRTNRGEFEGEQAFCQAGGEVKVAVGNAAAMAMFDCLMDGPLGWPEIKDRVSQLLAQAGHEMNAHGLEVMEGDLWLMWQHGLAFPLLSPPKPGQAEGGGSP